MKARELLAELTNKPYSFKKVNFANAYIFPVANSDDPYDISATGGAQQYIVGFTSYNGEIAINFQQTPLPDTGEIFELTGMGDAIRVLSTVAAIINKYISDHRPKRLFFITSKSQRRKEFYDKVVPKISRWIKGYKLEHMHVGDDSYGKYILVRDDLADNKELSETASYEIIEVFDKPYPYKPMPAPVFTNTVDTKSKNASTHRDEWKQFTTDSGIKYAVRLFAQDNALEVGFLLINDDDPDKWSTEDTNTGDAIKIYGTVLKIVKDYIRSDGEPPIIRFSGSTQGKIRLYDFIVKNIAKVLPNYKLKFTKWSKYSDRPTKIYKLVRKS